ncbi:MAG: hypothetical protein E6876_04355 [Clostridium sp.]|nr:hypothetical protein [Clostridium sp.]
MRLEELFKIEEREVKWFSPFERKDITVNRTYYIFDEIEFYQSEDVLKNLQKLKLTDEEHNILRNSLKHFIDVIKEEMLEEFIEDEEYKVLDKALQMKNQNNEAIRLYYMSTSADLLLTYLDDSFTIDEVRNMTDNEVEVKIFKAVTEDDEDELKLLKDLIKIDD